MNCIAIPRIKSTNPNRASHSLLLSTQGPLKVPNPIKPFELYFHMRIVPIILNKVPKIIIFSFIDYLTRKYIPKIIKAIQIIERIPAINGLYKIGGKPISRSTGRAGAIHLNRKIAKTINIIPRIFIGFILLLFY